MGLLLRYTQFSCVLIWIALGLCIYDYSCLSVSVRKEMTNLQFLKAMDELLFTTEFRTYSFVNMIICVLSLFGKILQKLFFGQLRPIESRKLNDRLLNYLLFKIVFVGTIFDLMSSSDVVKCIIWFSVLGLMKMFCLLSRDRFDYIFNTSQNVQTTPHKRILGLLISIMTINTIWFFWCMKLFDVSYSVFFLLTFECFTLFLETTQTVVKYGIAMFRRDSTWEARGAYSYYTEFLTDSLILLSTLLHYCQILYIHGISFTLIDAVLFINMRIAFDSLKEKIQSYRNYKRLVRAMHLNYPTLRQADFQKNAELDDLCLICRDKMETAKQLPCSHLFHESCIRAWLESHQNCPTCRATLIVEPVFDANNVDGSNGAAAGAFLPPPSWNQAEFHDVPPEMIQEVLQVLPNTPANIIAADLYITGSTAQTIENILENRNQQYSSPAPSRIAKLLHPDAQELSSIDMEMIDGQIAALEKSVQASPIVGFASSAKARENNLKARKLALQQQNKLRFIKKMKEAKLQKQQVNTISSDDKTNAENIVNSNNNNNSYDNDGNKVSNNSSDTAEQTSESIPAFSVSDSGEIRRLRALNSAEMRRQRT